MNIALKDIKPNPHRNLEAFPLNQAKVQELVASIKATDAGFWDNVLVRKAGDKYELAYGHHRLEAAKQAGLKEADFIVKKLSDADMLKIMVLENSQDMQRNKVNVLLEGVEAVVNAITAGTITIEVERVGKTTRYAPSYISGLTSPEEAKAYNVGSVALFLGISSKSGAAIDGVTAVLEGLELIERRILRRSEVEDIPTIDALQRRVREGWIEVEARERRAIVRQREEEALARAAAARKEAEDKRKAADLKNKEEQAKLQAKIREQAEALRLAQEEADREAAKKHKAELVEQQKRAEQRQAEFAVKRAELDAAVEKRKQAETVKREAIEERSRQQETPKIQVEELPTVNAEDVLKCIQKSIEWNRKAWDLSKAIKQNDLLALKRIKEENEENQKVSAKIANKFHKV